MNAMFVVISYKLQKYAEACNYELDFKKITKMNKRDFRVNPFSFSAVAACSGKMLKFSFDTYNSTLAFKFENHKF